MIAGDACHDRNAGIGESGDRCGIIGVIGFPQRERMADDNVARHAEGARARGDLAQLA